MADFALRCWCCRKEQGVSGPKPQFGFELAFIAQKIGWVGVVEHQRGRALVFCSNECLERCKTKKGGLRLRPPKIAEDGDGK